MSQQFELEVDRIATGGKAIGAGPDGRVVFVDGAIPGERVVARVTAEHSRRLEAVVVDVVEPSSDRVEPPCPNLIDGCGGCDWQHINPERQRSLRRDIVADCLRRLARLENIPIRSGPVLDPVGYRTTVRVAVVDGRPGYRRRLSRDVVAVDDCLVAHPLIEDLLARGRFGSAEEVTLRVGAATGERMVIVDGPTAEVAVPDDVVVASARPETASANVHDGKPGHRPHIHDTVGGIRLQISAGSFFQCRPDGAKVLAGLVADALADVEGTMLDAYCGVGLFGALAGTGRRVIGVESEPSAVDDARFNLGPHATVVASRFEHWNPEPVAVAVADPARSGLRQPAVDVLAATGARLIALVSCDPASLARDARLLSDAGYRLDTVTVVDLFGHTSHVETVSRFVLADRMDS